MLVLPSVHSANSSIHSNQDRCDRLADDFAGMSVPACARNIYSCSKFAAMFKSKHE